MEEKERIYIDFPTNQGSDLAESVNRFYKYFMPFLGVIWIINGVENLLTVDGNNIINIVLVILGSILLLFPLFQPLLYKKIGRLYIGFHPEILYIKRKYFEPPQEILWKSIDKIKIHYSKFMIYQSTNRDDVIIFEAPYSANEEIRQQLRKYAKLKFFKIEE